MPRIESSYRSPALYQTDLATILRGAVLPAAQLAYTLETFDTPDGDFMEIDRLGNPADPLVLVVHGFEGNSKSRIVSRIANYLAGHGYQVAALNFPGCGERMNRLVTSYHSGASHLIEWAIDYILRREGRERIDLVGVSLGGNVLLNYLARQPQSQPIGRAVALSVPCDLAGSEERIWNRLYHLYTRGFLSSIKEKAEQKYRLFPQQIDIDAVRKAKRIRDFDDCYTAPLNGFQGVNDYYAKASSKQRLHAITAPTLLLSALDDPFLSASCFPIAESANHQFLSLEAPATGGHLAYPSRDNWLERRIVSFLTGTK